MRRNPDFRLYWVEPDPDRERAVDPLGLGGQADRIADRLLPSLSVLTRRARYLSFFCWAVRNTNGQRNQIGSIHRLEAALAFEEAQKHREQTPSVCPDIVGRQRAYAYIRDRGDRLPTRPEGLYKNMAFAAYRPLMRSLGLLKPSRRPELTDDGEHLATLYQRNRGPKPRCLSEISNSEASKIRALLGLDFRAQTLSSSLAERRRRTFIEIRSLLAQHVSAPEILQAYDRIADQAKEAAQWLHRAFAWESLSLGLNLAFAMLLSENSMAPILKRFQHAVRGGSHWPGLQTFDPTDDAAAGKAFALLRKSHQLRIPALGLDPFPNALGERLVVNRDAEGFLDGLVERHQQVKLGDAWITLERGRLRVLTPKKNLDLEPGPRTYRLDAYAQLLHDIRLIP